MLGTVSCPPPGFRLIPAVFDEASASEILTQLEELPFRQSEMHGVVAKRTVVHCGWDYGYHSWRITPVDPPPNFLLRLRGLVIEAAGYQPGDFGETLVTRYPPGAGIGWHRDAPMFGDPVIGVSFGSLCTMRFKRPGHELPCAVVLPAGSVYVLSGAAPLAVAALNSSTEGTAPVRDLSQGRAPKQPITSAAAGALLRERSTHHGIGKTTL